MSRRRLALLALVPLAFAPGAAAGAAGTRTVVLQDIAFKPGTVTINRGSSVSWRWDDGRVAHNVRSVGSRRFAGSALKSTGTHRVTFRKAGTYRYTCTVHPGMDGTVRVR